MPKRLTDLIIVTYKTKSSGNPEITYLFSNAGDIRSTMAWRVKWPWKMDFTELKNWTSDAQPDPAENLDF